MEITGKRAMVVGGASGMARATAEALREAGAEVAILDLPKSAGAEVAAGHGRDVPPVRRDGRRHRSTRRSRVRSARSARCTSR